MLFKKAIYLSSYMSYMAMYSTNFHYFIFLISDFDDTCIVYINTN